MSPALLKKGRKEVFETSDVIGREEKSFDPAKQKEIKNYVVNDVLEKLEPHEKKTKSPGECDGSWSIVLDENENKSPKARIVLFGFFMILITKNRPTASLTIDEKTPDNYFCTSVRGWGFLGSKKET